MIPYRWRIGCHGQRDDTHGLRCEVPAVKTGQNQAPSRRSSMGRMPAFSPALYRFHIILAPDGLRAAQKIGTLAPLERNPCWRSSTKGATRIYVGAQTGEAWHPLGKKAPALIPPGLSAFWLQGLCLAASAASLGATIHVSHAGLLLRFVGSGAVL